MLHIDRMSKAIHQVKGKLEDMIAIYDIRKDCGIQKMKIWCKGVQKLEARGKSVDRSAALEENGCDDGDLE